MTDLSDDIRQLIAKLDPDLNPAMVSCLLLYPTYAVAICYTPDDNGQKHVDMDTGKPAVHVRSWETTCHDPRGTTTSQTPPPKPATSSHMESATLRCL